MTGKSNANDKMMSALSGLRAWVITPGMAGMDVQAKAVAEALGLNYEMKHVAPRGIWKLVAPWGPVGP